MARIDWWRRHFSGRGTPHERNYIHLRKAVKILAGNDENGIELALSKTTIAKVN